MDEHPRTRDLYRDPEHLGEGGSKDLISALLSTAHISLLVGVGFFVVSITLTLRGEEQVITTTMEIYHEHVNSTVV